ncbi:conserved hypothetical protein [Ricinus communis]|uniref:Uncharacterized protein n=1 Tax=Ricinus communis TaxID=3988 RepID=B9S6K0_RICCO|nr:conserved hypothetical protein [Ricinus communis]
MHDVCYYCEVIDHSTRFHKLKQQEEAMQPSVIGRPVVPWLNYKGGFYHSSLGQAARSPRSAILPKELS